eukprot:CAMPEP_0181323046 /NCGR_PEP_ID=MMETSP1101-20121128/19566_1 /TAXON_ID=46948 /ORGANISM="Rhodomonas abbreviata, Strain Caron Lab Isolate" /LENGTH=971 /DNA_ID=CAMNT_0023431027 /DNA_START=69 /DNA_END=2984 /DNA_ORIENTATION=-
MTTLFQLGLVALLCVVGREGLVSADNYHPIRQHMTFWAPQQYKSGSWQQCPLYFNKASSNLSRRVLVSTNSVPYSNTRSAGSVPTSWPSTYTSHSHSFSSGGSARYTGASCGRSDWDSKSFQNRGYSVTFYTSSTNSILAFVTRTLCTASASADNAGYNIPGNSVVYYYNGGTSNCGSMGWSTVSDSWTNNRAIVPSTTSWTSPSSVGAGSYIQDYHYHAFGYNHRFPTSTVSMKGSDKNAVSPSSWYLNSKNSNNSGAINVPTAHVMTCQKTSGYTTQLGLPPPNIFVYIPHGQNCPGGWKTDTQNAGKIPIYPNTASYDKTFGSASTMNSRTSLHSHTASVQMTWSRHSDNWNNFWDSGGSGNYASSTSSTRTVSSTNTQNHNFPGRSYKMCRPDYNTHCDWNCYRSQNLAKGLPAPSSTDAGVSSTYFEQQGFNLGHNCKCTLFPTKAPTASPTKFPTLEPTSDPTNSGCENLVWNENIGETDRDCGGLYCNPCPNGAVCSTSLFWPGTAIPRLGGEDCESGRCIEQGGVQNDLNGLPTVYTGRCESKFPTTSPSQSPTKYPTVSPSQSPSMSPSTPAPSTSPTSSAPTDSPTVSPSASPTTPMPSASPTLPPVFSKECNNTDDTALWNAPTSVPESVSNYPLHLSECRLQCVVGEGGPGDAKYLLCLLNCLDEKQPAYSVGCNVCMAQFASCAYNKPTDYLQCEDDPDEEQRPECINCDGKCLADTDGYFFGEQDASCIACAKRKCAGNYDCETIRPEEFDMLCCTGWDQSLLNKLLPTLKDRPQTPFQLPEAALYGIIGGAAFIVVVGAYAAAKRTRRGSNSAKMFQEYEDLKRQIHGDDAMADGKAETADVAVNDQYAKADPDDMEPIAAPYEEDAKPLAVATAAGAAVGGAAAWTISEDAPYEIPEPGAMVSRFSFHGEHADELSVPAGAQLELVEETGEWLVCRDKATGKTGLIPKEYVSSFE